ncbi:MAG: hypothetical protein HYR88_14330 [Verrucomicrobia bacterium]|nr:hypothetical protein [Verrucomicrobiota bacterium]MBI3870703.1 hypothetical protein [Verrucomicrobiota bacterium]
MFRAQHLIAAAGESLSAVPNDLTPFLLILGFFFVVGIGGLFVALVIRGSPQARGVRNILGERLLWRPESSSWEPLFDAPFRWLAIRGSNPATIQAALGLRNPKPCSWEEGMHWALDHRLFISPSVNGWILVMGSDLPDPADDPDRSYHFLTRMSRELGEVQFFSMNRMFSHHAWVMLERGRVRRAYAHAGETLWNEGEATEAEKGLRIITYDYCQAPAKSFFSHIDPLGAATEKVAALAARWSVDPTTVDFRRLRGHHGISGRFPSRFP